MPPPPPRSDLSQNENHCENSMTLCAVSLLCLLIISGHSCQFWACCENINIPWTIKSQPSVKCTFVFDFCMLKGTMQLKFVEKWVMYMVHGPIFMSDSKVWQWCREFEVGCIDVHDAGRQGRKQVPTDDLVQPVDQAIWKNNWFTNSVLSDSFSEILLSTLYSIVEKRLQYCKFCVR